MTAMQFGQTMWSAVRGKLEKARLYVISAQKAADVQAVEKTQQALQKGSGSLSNEERGNLCELTVQYNPSSISFQCNAETIVFNSTNQPNSSDNPTQSSTPPSVVMSVELIFDDVNQQDAFLSDKATITPGSVMADIGALHRVHSVQTQTDALVALLLRPGTRTVKFAWADLAFVGKVSQVQAKYVMFSPSGRPIRSKVRLELTQSIQGQNCDKYWENVLNKVFSEKDPLGGQKIAQEFGTLLNFDAF